MNKNLLKTALATLALAFTCNANAAEQVLYEYNYESATDANIWTWTGDIRATLNADDPVYGKYGTYEVSGGSGNRGGYIMWGSGVFGTEEVTDYIIEFDAVIKAGNQENRSVTQLAVVTEDMSKVGNNEYNGTNALFTLYNNVAKTTTFYINGKADATETVDLADQWYHFRLDVSGQNVEYTITDPADDSEKASGTYTSTATDNKALGIFFLNGRNWGKMSFDNLKIWREVEQAVASLPTITLTKVDGNDRIYTITTADAECTIHYTVNGGEEQTATGGSVEVRATADGTIVAYCTKDGAVNSSEASVEVTCGEITLNAPTHTITGLTGGYNATYTVNVDNKEILLSPTATLTYVFTPVDGTAGESVEIEDGGTITATAAGTYVVTASADGYTPSSITIDNTVAYELAKEFKLDEMTADDFTNTEIWVAGTGWPRDRWSAAGMTEDVVKYSIKHTMGGEDNKKLISVDGDVENAIEGLNLFTNRIPEVYIGFGLLATYETNGNSNYGYLTIDDAEEGQMAVYSGWDDYGSGEFTTVQAATDQFGLYRYDHILRNIKIYAPAASKTIPAEYGYASFSADKAVTVPEDVTVYKAAVSAEGDAIVLTPVDTKVIPANTGVLLYSETAGDKVFYTATEAADADFSGNELIATSVAANATVPTTGTYYALRAGVAEFAVINGGVELSANKAYIKAPENSEAKPMRMVIGGQTTGINEVDAADGSADGAYYTLQGVKVENPTKGLYIHNGKKVIIK